MDDAVYVARGRFSQYGERARVGTDGHRLDAYLCNRATRATGADGAGKYTLGLYQFAGQGDRRNGGAAGRSEGDCYFSPSLLQFRVRFTSSPSSVPGKLIISCNAGSRTRISYVEPS